MGLPPVALVHGFATSARRTWQALGWVDLLAESGREVHAPDLLGHGDAPKPHDPAAYGDLEGWLADHLPPGPLDAIGFSLGARLLLGIAADRPSLFRRLAVAGVGDSLFGDNTAHRRRIASAIAAPTAPEDPEMGHFFALAGSPEADRGALAACMEGLDPVIDPGRLAAVTCPVLVVLGDRDFAGPGDGLVAALGCAELRTLPGVDHFATPKSFGFLDAALQWVAGGAG